ncbi:DMT family transporter [Rhodococcoides kyotonense]|uniref:EamA domain-containing membrane protein RarD n=1 Tax=Rhodococcoides kyotonense TaxID=398843 RepID=A0A239MEU7_9NOCA|nr:DMT family transporter [Rhodococcus kyotonensis]SNT40498.1 EamA domain-containing membrane protein RarD [Rhodococcus kyotonensis]
MSTGTTVRGSTFGIFALLAATLFWAGNYVVGGAAVSSISPLDLTASRWVIALVPLLALAHLIEKPDWSAVARSWPTMIAPALLGLLAYNFLLYSALQHTTPVSASLINAFNPALISLAAALFLQQRLNGTSIAGIGVALVGVLWVLSDGHPTALLSSGLGLGDLLMVGAICAWTAYTLSGRRRSTIPPITATAVQALIVIVVLIPVVLLTGGPHIPTEPGTIWALLFVGLGPSVVSYVMWNKALTVIPPARAGVFLNLITVFTVVISVGLGQSFTLAQAIGGVTVIAGVVLTNLKALRRPTETT